MILLLPGARRAQLGKAEATQQFLGTYEYSDVYVYFILRFLDTTEH